MTMLYNRVKETGKHGLIYGLGGSLKAALFFLLIPVYTRYIPTSDLGIFAIINIIVLMAGLLPQLTFGPALFRSYYDYEDNEDRAVVVSTAFYLCLGMSLIVTLTGYLISPWLSGVVFREAGYAGIVRMAFVIGLFNSVNVIGFAVFRARKWSFRYIAVNLIVAVIQLAVSLYLIVGKRMGLTGLILGILSASCANLVIVPMIWSELRLKLSVKELRKMVKYGAPFVPEGILTFMHTTLSRFILLEACGLGQLGIYSIVFYFGRVIEVFFSMPLNLIEPVVIFDAYNGQNAKEFYSRFFTYVCFTGIFLCLWISVIAGDIMYFMTTSGFWSASSIVPVICLYFFMRGIRGTAAVGLLVMRKTKYFALAELVGFLVSIFMMMFLVPRYGMPATAVSMLMYYVTVFTVRFVFSRRVYKVNYEWARIIKISLGAAVLYFVAIAVSTGNKGVDIALKTLVVSLLPGLLYFIGFYHDKEKSKAMELVRKIYGMVS